jgi:hypothetical protein
MTNIAVSASDIADKDAVRTVQLVNDYDPHFELLKVTIDKRTGEEHVELADALDFAESWGITLADIALTVARQDLVTDREDGDLFAAVMDGFNEGLRKLAKRE